MDFVTSKKVNTKPLNEKIALMELSFALVVTNKGVTRHSITNKGVMLDGVWLDDSELARSIDDLKQNCADRIDLCMEIIPCNVLVNNDKYLVWYAEPKLRDIWFAKSEVCCVGKVPHPKIIFIASKLNRSINLSAVMSNVSRPDSNTELFHVPLGNIYKTGDLCIGTAKMPSKVSINSIDEIEAVLFNSNYSGYKFDSFVPTIEGQESPKLIDGLLSISTKPTFPDEWLLAKHQTLGELLSSL